MRIALFLVSLRQKWNIICKVVYQYLVREAMGKRLGKVSCDTPAPPSDKKMRVYFGKKNRARGTEPTCRCRRSSLALFLTHSLALPTPHIQPTNPHLAIREGLSLTALVALAH